LPGSSQIVNQWVSVRIVDANAAGARYHDATSTGRSTFFAHCDQPAVRGDRPTGLRAGRAELRGMVSLVVFLPIDESPATVIGKRNWLSPDDVAETYPGGLAGSRCSHVLRTEVSSGSPAGPHLTVSCSISRPGIDRADTERTWWLDHRATGV